MGQLSISDIIQIVSILLSLIISIVSICIAVKTLKQNNEITRNASRAYIVFYIDKFITESHHTLIIKNFGKSSGKLISLELDPPLDYSKSRLSGISNDMLITNHSNIYLAPNQTIKSSFYFNNYPDKKFKVKIKYETLDKKYTDEYLIDLTYSKSIITTKSTISDNSEALESIRDSILGVSDKLI